MLNSNKKLSEMIASFKNQAEARSQKIRDKISSLEKEAGELKVAIEAETKRLVDCELVDDSEGQERAIMALREFRQKQVELHELTEAYRQELDVRKQYNIRDIDLIKTVARQEREDRHQKIMELGAEREAAELEIKELQNKIEQISNDIRRARYDTEEKKLFLISKYLEPKINKIPHFEREGYFRHWIDGDSEGMERILAKNETAAPA